MAGQGSRPPTRRDELELTTSARPSVRSTGDRHVAGTVYIIRGWIESF